MRLRKLEIKDAPFMLEWMHDDTVTEYLAKDFSSMTIEDCTNFIKSAQDQKLNAHYAVVADNDEYMGTVSLKNINNTDAEFAITMRKTAQGKGFARFAIREIMIIAFKDYNLNTVYWDVLKANTHAVHFYNKFCGENCKDREISAYYLSKMNIDKLVQDNYYCYLVDADWYDKIRSDRK